MELTHWYALKIFFNKVFEMEGLLRYKVQECYLPVERIPLRGLDRVKATTHLAAHPEDPKFQVVGPDVFKRVPRVSSLLFVKAGKDQILDVAAFLRGNPDFENPHGFVYKRADWKAFAQIPEKQMQAFRLVADSEESGLQFYADDEITRFKQGARVRVKEGPFKGAEGYIRRIHKNRRLLVSIEGIVAVVTSYIPQENLEILEP